MNYLGVSEYDSQEKEALASMPNRVVLAFMPVTFNAEGYPSRVNHERELFKYMDVMHELRFDHDFQHLLGGGLTQAEFDLLSRLSRKALDFCAQRFGQQAVPRSAVLRMINLMRHLRYLYGERKPRVLEIGAGCGYLGAMLTMEGHGYAATDVAQAFYLYQNQLWNFFTDGRVAEWARPGEQGTVAQDQVLHLPWWEWVRATPAALGEFDVITCNHALCEMHPDSLSYSLKLAKALWQGKRQGKAFVFEGWGLERYHGIDTVMQRMAREGFALVHYDPMITVLVPAEGPDAAGAQELPRKVQRQILVMRGKELESQTASENSFEPQFFHAAGNPLSQAIQQGRAQDESRRTVTLDHLREFYHSLLPGADLLTADERFMLLVGSMG